MKIFKTREQSIPLVSKVESYVHHPMGPAQVSQQAGIRNILHSTGAQAKLTFGQPNDQYEQEADRVADDVMAMPDPKLQCQPVNEEEEETVQAKPLAAQITPLVQRQEEPPEEEEEPVQAKSKSGEISTVTPSLESRISSMKGGGQPLDLTTRAFFEPRFGHKFSNVRVHSDSAAADIAKSINARAFTLGNHVVMGSGEYHPNSQSGKRLLGHELTHVVQQSVGINRKKRALLPPYFAGPIIQREAPTLTPAQRLQQTYNQALTRLQGLNGRMHGYLSAAPLNGAQTTILTNTTTNAGVSTTTNFRLTVRSQSLPNAHAVLQRHAVSAPTGSGTTRTQMVDMTMTVDPPAGTNAVNDLTETLLHEGLHMLIHMDGFLPSAQQSPQRARLSTYRTVAQGHADYARLRNELTALITPHFTTQVVGANPSSPVSPQVSQRITALSRSAAQTIITDLIEEKFIEDTVATTMGRTRQPNADLALQEIGNDLVNLGMTQQQLVTGTNLAAMRSIIQKATQIFNAIDQHTSRAGPPVPNPSPTPSPSPAPRP